VQTSSLARRHTVAQAHQRQHRVAQAADAEARRVFDGLPFTHRKEYVRWIEGAKKAETRQNRLAKTLMRLKGGS